MVTISMDFSSPPRRNHCTLVTPGHCGILHPKTPLEPQGPQGPRGNDGNAAVIMDIIQNDQHITTKPLTTDQAIHVKQLAEKACKEVYR